MPSNAKQSPTKGVRPNYNERGETVSWFVDASYTHVDEVSGQKEVKRATATVKTYEEAVNKKQQLQEQLVYGIPIDKKEKKWTLLEAKDNVFKNHWEGSKAEKTALINYHTCEDYFGKNRPLDTIDEDLIDDFKDHLKELGLSNSTINRKLSALSKLLTQAVKKRRLKQKPYIEFYKKSKSRKRVLSDIEEKMFLDICQQWGIGEVSDYFIFLLESGVRPWKEGLVVRKTDVDLKNNTIHVWQTKQSTDRTIFMTGKLREVIQRRMRVIQDPQGRLFSFTRDTFFNYWYKVKAQMDLENDKTFIPYMLRHTCCTRLAKSNLSLLKIKEWMGHKSILTTMEYAHLNTQSLMDCAKALENHRLDLEFSRN